MKWFFRLLAAMCLFALMNGGPSGLQAEPLQFSAQQNMSYATAPVSAPRCGSTPMIRAGFTLAAFGIRLAQDDVGEWCDADNYCRTGSFCCGGGCCQNGSNCCEQDGGCCPGNLPIGCGPKCYANQADAQADGCSNWEVCGAPVR